ncbi:unnamed protein product [Vitrella brassicaformis CCMP3155]|uniref:Saccharopine dehydrogenase NADP binding domain-containing protein n=1 Tax=Vitrella brassicaformis (strain CCMP3155) TaxID=1169540 RepID=A0A0G4EWP5_VITBC|nr:unnamed protein product [Vitrella brassicaformis CCMP3155]|eukprot:CEM03402.1 unnamed protein product [Vitrella brassicaformis CCMP3155]
MGERAFDIVVFGASGFTGEYVVSALKDGAAKEARPIKWAVAGRSADKLKGVLERVGAADIPTVIADVSDEGSMKAMCERTKVLLNCVGPFRYHGEAVVKACVQCATHYLDICGEPEFLERMELKYHQQALGNGCLIVGSCGFDSVPADIGSQVAREQFKSPAVPYKVETFLQLTMGEAGGSIHYTTYQCAVEGFGSAADLSNIRKELAPSKPKVTKLGAKPKLEKGPFSDKRMPGMSGFLFPGADASVIKRSQESFTAADPSYVSFHPACYILLPDGKAKYLMMLFGGMFSFLAKYSLGRQLLLAAPGIFTYGMFTHSGPTKEQVAQGGFEMTIFASGFSSTPTDKDAKSDLDVTVKLKGPEIGYAFTSMSIAQLGLCLLEERDKMPAGGVLTPAFAFDKTKAVDRLKANGLNVTIESGASTATTAR